MGSCPSRQASSYILSMISTTSGHSTESESGGSGTTGEERVASSIREHLLELAEVVKEIESEKDGGPDIDWDIKLTEKMKHAAIAVIEFNGLKIITDSNIFHEIALKGAESKNGDKFTQFQPFMTWLLKKDASSVLLQQKSKIYHRRPFHLALEKGNSGFVKMLLEEFTNPTPTDNMSNLTLEELLRPKSPNVDELNCVHLAIAARSPHTIEIIEKCKNIQGMFLQDDFEKAKGTPLHYAAVCDVPDQPESATKHDFDIIEITEKLIQICPDALRAINNDGLTPYQSRIEFLRGTMAKANGTTPKPNGGAPRQQTQTREIDAKGIDEIFHSHYEDPKDKQTGIKGLQRNQDSQIQPPLDGNESKEESPALRQKIIEDRILCTIREYCVKNMDRFELVKALYRGTKERETYFDLLTQPSLSISLSNLEKLARHLKFESILRYVALPRIEVTEKTEITLDNDRERWHIAEIFQWLRQNGVKKIVSVIVIDDIEPSHSDGAIEGALVWKEEIKKEESKKEESKKEESKKEENKKEESKKEEMKNEIVERNFDIEIWDWKKLDINCDIIARCAPGVREITLYSSGNNAVLMGWSSMDGLRNRTKFPKLEKVNLIYQEGLEKKERLGKYVSDFKVLVESVSNNNSTTDDWDDLDLDDEEDPNSNSTTNYELARDDEASSNRKQTHITVTTNIKESSYAEGLKKENEMNNIVRQHQWLEKSNEFRSVISNIRDISTGVRPIKIAIIDNGVDATLSVFDHKIETGASFFSFINNGNTLYYPYYMISGTLNHGSLVAMLVCKVCPKVKLYICRLGETDGPMGARYITTESAARAIEWATEQKVDIMCMSWSMEENTNNPEAQHRLETALGKADDNGRGIIMISSASDQGGNSVKTWPGESGKCIRIGASTPTGDKSFQVHQRDMDFLFPGEAIQLGTNEVQKTYDGSSFATAIAAGTAGLLIYLDRLAEKWGDHVQEWGPLKGRSAMKKMFEGMSLTGNNSPTLEKFNNQFDQTSFVDLEESCTKLGKLLGRLKVGHEYYGQK
ncbi:hypothetical protein J3E69DRAFT_339920 [Trichoderma sp. SZMC 28015]